MAKPVVFSAIRTSGSVTSGNYFNSYTKFLITYGDAFNLGSGVFTAPRSGIYQFSAAATFFRKGENKISVEKNGTQILQFYSENEHERTDDDTLSFNFIMQLQKYDTIRLKVTRGKFWCNTSNVCVFNGYFIRKI